MNSKIDLDAIKERCDKATPGPWKIKENSIYGNIYLEDDDMDYISHARQDIPALLDYIAQLEAERDELIEMLERSLAQTNEMIALFDKETGYRSNESVVTRQESLTEWAARLLKGV